MPAFVVRCRSRVSKRLFAIFVVMATTKEDALALVQKAAPDGNLMVEESPLPESAVKALRLEPGEVRKL